jgi:hypothetical protein
MWDWDTIKNYANNAKERILGNPMKASITLHKAPKKPSQEAPQMGISTRDVLNGGLTGAGSRLTQENHVLHVQYNPSSISFRANATSQAVQTLRQFGQTDYPSHVMKPPSITMSVELCFDAVNVKDSFMADKLEALSVSGVVSSRAASRNTYTVQPQTNGLLALVLFKDYQLVTFNWAGLSFEGEVCEAQAKYMMFSVSGQPVRSTVNLQIRQQLSGGSNNWNAAFDRCFGKSGDDNQSGRKNAGQAVSNLLNLGW